jgi:[acyl-carrier-protein] S-malonyltransferase
VLEAVNFNAPGQVVIAGDRPAVERAATAAKAVGAKRALLLPVSVPSHCALMKDAATELAAILADTEIQMPTIAVLHNVSVAEAASVDDLRELLARQLYSPVRWVETIEALARRGVPAVVEAGPGKVLTGLGKRIDKALPFVPVLDPPSLSQALETTTHA